MFRSCCESCFRLFDRASARRAEVHVRENALALDRPLIDGVHVASRPLVPWLPPYVPQQNDSRESETQQVDVPPQCLNHIPNERREKLSSFLLDSAAHYGGWSDDVAADLKIEFPDVPQEETEQLFRHVLLNSVDGADLLLVQRVSAWTTVDDLKDRIKQHAPGRLTLTFGPDCKEIGGRRQGQSETLADYGIFETDSSDTALLLRRIGDERFSLVLLAAVPAEWKPQPVRHASPAAEFRQNQFDSYLRRDDNSNRCPRCQMPIERRDGCDHMHCLRCCCHFDIRTGLEYPA